MIVLRYFGYFPFQALLVPRKLLLNFHLLLFNVSIKRLRVHWTYSLIRKSIGFVCKILECLTPARCRRIRKKGIRIHPCLHNEIIKTFRIHACIFLQIKTISAFITNVHIGILNPEIKFRSRSDCLSIRRRLVQYKRTLWLRVLVSSKGENNFLLEGTRTEKFSTNKLKTKLLTTINDTVCCL